MNKKERLENSMEQKRGRASILFEHPPVIRSIASVAGTKEGKGPLGSLFDAVEQDDKMGKENWEEAESAMQEKAAGLALKKGKLTEQEMDYSFAGDLLGQLIATSFGSGSLHVPLFGLYGACSTMGEALGLGAMTVNAGYGKNVLAMASSHFATAEKEFRFPLAYGNQRPKSATWTVTGCGAAVIGKHGEKGIAQIAGITTGQVVDAGVRDSMNMGAAMAPAAFHTVMQNLKDLEITKEQLEYGKRLMELLKQPLSEPLSLHAQVITLCAATHKLFLDVPVKELKKFQKDMLAYLDQKHPQIGEEIEELHSLSDTLINKIIDAVKEYKSQVVK